MEQIGISKSQQKDLVFSMNQKKMLGYSKAEQKQINLRAMKHEKNASIVRYTYHMLEKFTIFNLYLKLDATPEQMKKFEDNIAGMLAGYSTGDIDILQLKDVSNQHIFIDEYVLKIPFRVKMMMGRSKPPKNAHDALVLNNCVNGAFGAWFGMAVYAAIELGYTDDQIKILMDNIIDHIDSYGRGLMNDKDVDDTLVILEEETGYHARAMEGYDV